MNKPYELKQIMRSDTYIYAVDKYDVVYRLNVQEWSDAATVGTVAVWERAVVWQRGDEV